jgi:uncharacterized protein
MNNRLCPAELLGGEGYNRQAARFLLTQTHHSHQPELPPEYYWKQYTCPLTARHFSSIAVKARSYIVKRREPDFRPIYQGLNPMCYSIVVSPAGFAAEEEIYGRSPRLLFKDRDNLLAELSDGRDGASFSQIRDLPLACRSFELALGCTAYLRVAKHDIASLALRASWMFFEWAESGFEPARASAQALRGIALEHYLLAYEKEDVTKLKLGSGGVAYLIAELLRERGDYADSLRWFSRVVADKSTGGEIMRQARNQMELCRSQRKAAQEGGAGAAALEERRTERCSYQLYTDQVRWLAALAARGGMVESAVLRGAIDGLMSSGEDFSRFTSAEQLQEWLRQRLSSG